MPVSDIRVREALFRAIDYDAIKASIFHGRALDRMPPRAISGMGEVDASWTDYAEALWEYDPERSRQLLTEAGYPDGFDLWIGQATPAGTPYLSDLAEAVQAYWSAIGVRGTIHVLEDEQYQAIQGPADHSVGGVVFASTGVLGPAPSNMSWVWGRFGGHAIHADRRDRENPIVFLPELDELVYESVQERDPAVRKQMIDDFIKMGLDTYTSYTFGQVPSLLATAPSVTFKEFPVPLTTQSPPYYSPLAIHTDQ